jgi:general nucleoside transport system permease protein
MSNGAPATVDLQELGVSRKKVSPLVLTLLSVFFGLVIGGIVLAVAGYDPFKAYWVILVGTFSRPKYIAYTVIYATPLIITGLSFAFANKTGLFNIGAEGQFIIGAIAAAVLGYYLHLPPVLHVLACLLVGMVAAAVWGGLAGYLKARFGVHEVISTIMLNWIALYLNNYVVSVIKTAEHLTNPTTPMIRSSARIELFAVWKDSAAGQAWRGVHPFWDDILRTPFNLGIVFALVFAVVVWFILNRTTLGYELRAVGYNRFAAEYGGINVKRSMFFSMAIGGALAGAAGVCHVLGWTRYIAELAASEGYGFDGLACALIGSSNPFGCILGGLLFGTLKYGGSKIQNELGAPTEIINIVIGMIVFFVAMPKLMSLLINQFRRGENHVR